jgi:hypothetical protein
MSTGSLAKWGIALDTTGRVVEVLVDRSTPEFDRVRQCALDVLANEVFPCLGGDEVWQLCYYTTG